MIEIVGLCISKLAGIIAALAGLGFLIAFHEFGHWLFANIFGISTPTFSIGMGPQIFAKKIGKTNFTLSAIPLGGYVEIAGLAEVGQGEQKESLDRSARSFFVKPYWQKFLVLMGGILFNLIAAYIILVALFMTGMPKTALLTPEHVPAIINVVKEGQPAYIAGLQAGDQLLAVEGIEISSASGATQALRNHKDTEITLKIDRHGQKQEIRTSTTAQGTLGIAFEQPEGKLAPLSFSQALSKSAQVTMSIMGKLLLLLKNIVSARGLDSLGGPLAIMAQMTQSAGQGLAIFFTLLAYISLNLAALNLLPLPILDGGQLVLTTIESILGRPLSEKPRLYIHYACWLFVLGLFVLITVKDVNDLFFGIKFNELTQYIRNLIK